MTRPDTRHSDADMWLTLQEAAKAFDVSLSTLHRKRRAGDLENVGAFKDQNSGAWKIPRQGLARLGYQELIPPVVPGQMSIDDVLEGPEASSDTASYEPPAALPDTPIDTPDTELTELREQLAHAQKRADIAEALANERAERITDLQGVMRLLGPGPSTQEDAQAAPGDGPSQPETQPPSWDASEAPTERKTPPRSRFTALSVISWIAAGLFILAATLFFLDGAMLAGALQALGAVLFAATGFVANAKRRARHPA